MLQFKNFVENTFDYDSYYAEMEPKLLNNPAIANELATNHIVTIYTVKKEMGVEEGLANFLTRMFNNRHGNKNQAAVVQNERNKLARQQAESDEYLYHVTTKRKMPLIKKQGLVPGAEGHFSNYKNYSSGKIFLSEKGGIGFWKNAVENHEYHNFDKQSPIVLLKILKSNLAGFNLIPDELGTKDSGYPSYYTVSPIPKNIILMEK